MLLVVLVMVAAPVLDAWQNAVLSGPCLGTVCDLVTASILRCCDGLKSSQSESGLVRGWETICAFVSLNCASRLEDEGQTVEFVNWSQANFCKL